METIVVTETVQSPDKCVLKTEYVDKKFLHQLSVNPDIEKETRAILRNILKSHIKRGNQIDVIYVLGRSIKHEFLGRWIAKGSIGLQSLPKDIRNAIAGNLYWDVDMVNAQPTLLVQYCEKNNWNCVNLKKYIDHREELLEEVMDFTGCERWKAKERIVSILFGGSTNGLPRFFQNELYNELMKISQLVWDKNIDILKSLAKLPNHLGKGLAQILQTEERKCLESMDLAFTKNNRSLDTYIHDGGLIKKFDNEKEFPVTLLKTVEKFVYDHTGYAIKLAIKPMITSFEKEIEEEDEYAEMKAVFEKTYFKLNSPSVYCRLFEDGFSTISYTDLVHQQQNLLLKDETSFITKWTKDKNIKTYEKLEFAPKQNIRPDFYNIFTKFKILPKEGADLSIIHEVLFNLCGKDVLVKEYVEKWLAHIIQKPYLKTKICLVFQGEEGVGKDTFWEFIGNILGNKYFFNTSTPENNVFHQFNSGTETAVIVKFEEANFQTNKSNADKLKSIITKERETYINKGHDGIILNDYRNFVMTTNNEIPVILSDTDRRFMLIRASSEHRNDKPYWNTVYKNIQDITVQEAYHNYLLNLDITEFEPTIRIKTEYYNEVKMALSPYHARFLYDKIMTANVIDNEFEGNKKYKMIYKAFALWKECASCSTKFEVSSTKFGKDIKIYCDAGVILKDRDKKGFTYEILPTKCLEFMVSQKWIAEDSF